MMKTLSLCTLILLSGCSIFNKFKSKDPNADIRLDASLVKSYGDDLLSTGPYPAPFITSYKIGDKNLVYVAGANHQAIDKAIKDFEPHFILLEGSAFTIVSDPDDLQYAHVCEKRKYKYCGVDAYAIIEAEKREIPFSYAEPSDAGIHTVLNKKGVSDEELIAFYTLRNLVTGNKKEKLKEVLARSSKKFRAKKEMSEKSFKKLFKEKMGVGFNLKEVNAVLVSPMDKSPKWSHKLASQIESLREQFLLKHIENRLNKHKNVLVVYGVEQVLKHKPMLESVFGVGESFKAP